LLAGLYVVKELGVWGGRPKTPELRRKRVRNVMRFFIVYILYPLS
jgi:hypothetical protein